MPDDKKPSAPISSKDTKRAKSERLSEKIKENQRIKELKQFQEDFKKRIQLARDGRVAFDKNNIGGAVADFKYFLQLTARSHGVEVKDLNPKLFDHTVRTSESLLVAAVCFDLVKIYDRVAGSDEDFRIYLRLLVLFTHGMPFQNFIADNLFRFLQYTTHIAHKNDLEAAHKVIGKKKGCFIATAAFDDDENAIEVLQLRMFRDTKLVKSAWGRGFVQLYYCISPSIAALIRQSALLKKITRAVLKQIVSWLEIRF